MYAIPHEYYEKYSIRRYGFHGTSHKFVSGEAIKFGNLDPENAKVIVCHLGNGASVSASIGGKCVDTSMGLTPLEGLIMGTRSGDLDPAVIQYICNKENKTVDEVLNMLNKKSGLLGHERAVCLPTAVTSPQLLKKVTIWLKLPWMLTPTALQNT